MGGSAFTATSSALIATGTISSTSAMASVIPVIGPIIAGVTIALSLIFGRKGPKQKVATTKIVNDVEPQLQKNLAGYLALARRYRAAQAQALANFDAGWLYVTQNCGQSAMGDPGQACIKDRQAGACTWRDTGSQCWNWFSAYRDPIANDAAVVDDPVINAAGFIIDLATNRVLGTAVSAASAAGDAGAVVGSVSDLLSSLGAWALPAALAAAVWAVAS
jgi:hypothetical protein